jgi:hypothetical protein
MGFDEEKVVKAIQEHGEDNMEAIANALLSCPVSDVTKIYCLLTLKK